MQKRAMGLSVAIAYIDFKTGKVVDWEEVTDSEEQIKIVTEYYQRARNNAGL